MNAVFITTFVQLYTKMATHTLVISNSNLRGARRVHCRPLGGWSGWIRRPHLPTLENPDTVRVPWEVATHQKKKISDN